MSEFHVEVVRIGEIEPHPNADRLEITRIHGGYPCIIKKGSFQEGDIAVYIPIDTVLPDDERFEFLTSSDRKRLRAKRLRGIFSMGLIVPPDEGMTLGQDVTDVLGIKKWEPTIPATMGGENEPAPKGWFFPCYTDIEGFRRWPGKIDQLESVVITEKIHGANGRYAHDGERLWVGSRTCIKRRDEKNLWWKVAIELGLENKLSRLKMHVFFGEVYGQVQDLRYGHEGKNTASFRVFDVFDVRNGRYLDHYDAQKAAEYVGVDWVPKLYVGKLADVDINELAEGTSMLADNVREGFVVKPVKERYDDQLGRVILKMHGEGFLTRKGG